MGRYRGEMLCVVAGRNREMLVWVDIEGRCCGGQG